MVNSTEQLSIRLTPNTIDDVISALSMSNTEQFKNDLRNIQVVKNVYNTIDRINTEINKVNEINVVDTSNYDEVKSKLENIKRLITSNDRIAKTNTGSLVLSQINNELNNLKNVSEEYEEIEGILKELRKYAQ